MAPSFHQLLCLILYFLISVLSDESQYCLSHSYSYCLKQKIVKQNNAFLNIILQLFNYCLYEFCNGKCKGIVYIQ